MLPIFKPSYLLAVTLRAWGELTAHQAHQAAVETVLWAEIDAR